MKKNVVLINTGGTISMQSDGNDGVDIKKDSNIVQNIMIQFNDMANIKNINLLSKPSPHIEPYDMYNLYNLIYAEINKDDVDAVVVTHGTDTMEETSFFIQLLTNTSKPIVFTGSMNNISDNYFDGPANISGAILTAISNDSIGKGVLIHLNNDINIPDYTIKTDTTKLNTFKSLEFGPIGNIKNGIVNYDQFYKTNQSGIFLDKFENYNVPIIKCYTGMDDSIFKFCIQNKVDGIIVESFGKGNVPKTLVNVIDELIELKIPVILTSRCPMGRVDDDYSYEGGGKDLFNRGIILSDLNDSPKARLKLLVALNANINIRKYFKNKKTI